MTESVDFENTANGQSEHPAMTIQLTKVPEERFNTLSHLFGGILSFIGLLVLLYRAPDLPTFLVSTIYGVSNMILFFASGICHSQKLHEDQQTFWGKIDQIAIYLMIAGTYTPIVFLTLGTAWQIGLLIGQWSFAVIGIILKIGMPSTPRWIKAGIYLVQGWMILPAIKILFTTLPALLFFLIIGGGLFYSIGTVFYITKKPKLWPGIFGAHELWHVFVLLGAASFYMVVFSLI
jgi:hemolysin III